MTDELDREIESKSREIVTDGYPLAVGEIISMYKEGEIELHPEFQRVYRWTDRQKTDLIESVLLGIPIPSIFVSQRDDGIWDVIDGVQRLSTIMEYVGVYKNEMGETVDPFSPLGATYLPSLEGVFWEDFRNDGTASLGVERRRFFRQSRVQIQLVKKNSDSDAKYDLFQRLNSGAVLSNQEIRNCILVMINRDLFESLKRCSLYEPFSLVTTVSKRKEEESFRDELVLRFFAQISYTGPSHELTTEFGEHLTDWMRREADKGEKEFRESLFRRVFDLILNCGTEDAMRRFDSDENRRKGPFSTAAFEFISTGVASNIDYWERNPERLNGKLIEFWSNEEYNQNTGAGISARKRFPKLITLSRQYFAEED